jgi:hypothetical protein
MPIQRFYNLPSCTFQIEGISTEGGDRLSILTNFECKFHHNGIKISGGRELLDHLIQSTGRYAQALQTANPLPTGNQLAPDHQLVSLEPVGIYLHMLTIKSSDDPAPVEVQLNTVQLFDLVESIDRLCIDPQAVLDLNSVIEPVVSTAKTVISLLPALIGVSSLAIASAILFLVPTPKPDPKPQPQPVSLVLPQTISINR